jgi:hypothetical protein
MDVLGRIGRRHSGGQGQGDCGPGEDRFKVHFLGPNWLAAIARFVV